MRKLVNVTFKFLKVLTILLAREQIKSELIGFKFSVAQQDMDRAVELTISILPN